MKVTMVQSRLLDALKKVQAAANAKELNGILGNVKVVAKDGKIAFTTTNTNITLHCVADAEVAEEGEILIPMKVFLSEISVLPEGTVRIESKDDKVTISGGSTKYRLAQKDVRDFPQLPKDKAEDAFSIEARKLALMLTKTAYAQSMDGVRRTLAGVLVAVEGDKIRCVATDGRRLSIAEDELANAGSSQVKEYIVPSAAVAVLQKLLDTDGEVKVSSMGTQLKFEVNDGTYSFITKLTDGNYPNYAQVIPATHNTEAIIGREELISALGRVAVLALVDTTAVKMTFADNRLMVEVCGEEETGVANDEIPIKYEGEKVEIRFNPKYVLDPVRSVKSDEVKFELLNGMSPAVIKAATEKFMCVLMPLRIS